MSILQDEFYYCEINGFYTITEGAKYFKHMSKGTKEEKVREEVRNLNKLLKLSKKTHTDNQWFFLIILCICFPILIPIVIICAKLQEREFEKAFTPQCEKLKKHFDLSMSLTVISILITSFITIIANKYGNENLKTISIKCIIGCVAGVIYSIISYIESKNYKVEMKNIIKKISSSKRVQIN